MLYVDFLKAIKFFSFTFCLGVIFICWIFITYKENVYVTVFEIYENFAVYFSASLVLAVPIYLVFGRFITSIIEYFVIKIIVFYQDKKQ